MMIRVIVQKGGRVAGATKAVRPVESRVGHPSAWLTAGPNQSLVEIDVPEEIVPPDQADPARIERFFAELADRVRPHK
jgi:hypothetical protein